MHYFRTFGSIAYAHVPNSLRKKLDDKSIKCVLLGVSDESKGYRLYDPVSKKVLTNRDVVFDENGEWNWNKELKESSGEELIDTGDRELEETYITEVEGSTSAGVGLETGNSNSKRK